MAEQLGGESIGGTGGVGEKDGGGEAEFGGSRKVNSGVVDGGKCGDGGGERRRDLEIEVEEEGGMEGRGNGERVEIEEVAVSEGGVAVVKKGGKRDESKKREESETRGDKKAWREMRGRLVKAEEEAKRWKERAEAMASGMVGVRELKSGEAKLDVPEDLKVQMLDFELERLEAREVANVKEVARLRDRVDKETRAGEKNWMEARELEEKLRKREKEQEEAWARVEKEVVGLKAEMGVKEAKWDAERREEVKKRKVLIQMGRELDVARDELEKENRELRVRVKGEEIRVAEDETELVMTIEEREDVEVWEREAKRQTELRREAERKLKEMEGALVKAKEEARIAKNCYESEKKRRGEKILAAQVREEEAKRKRGNGMREAILLEERRKRKEESRCIRKWEVTDMGPPEREYG